MTVELSPEQLRHLRRIIARELRFLRITSEAPSPQEVELVSSIFDATTAAWDRG